MVEREHLLVANIIEEGRWGGPQKRISMVAKALRAQAVETVVFLPEQDSLRFQNALRDGDTSFVALPLVRLGRNARTILNYFFSFVPDVFRIYRGLRQRQYDLVHISGGVWQIKGALAARWAGLPVIWHLNDTRMPSFVVAAFSFLAPRLANAFFVSADRCRTTYLSSPRLALLPCYLVPPPVDTRSSARLSPDVRIKALPGVKIVSVANINPVKGLDILVAAADILNKSGHLFTVVIVGPVFSTQETYFSLLRHQIAQAGLTERVVFLGAVEDAGSCMEAADIYVCSSIAEAGPMTVWEAMAASKPVVSTDVGDIAIYVKSGESGYVVPVNDPGALADAVSTLMADAAKRRDFGERGRKIVETNLDLLVIAEKTADGYRHVLSSIRAKHSGNHLGTNIYATHRTQLPEHRGKRRTNGRLIVGIDASNIRAGGGVTHLVELLQAFDPVSDGIEHIIIWAGEETLGSIEDRPWLAKCNPPALNKGLIARAFWQRFRLSQLARIAGCSVLFIPGGAYVGTFHPVVTMSQNLLPFETREMRRYGWSLQLIKFLLLRWIQSYSFQESDGVIFLTDYARDAVVKVAGGLSGRNEIIPHGINPRFFRMPRPQRSSKEFSDSQPCRVLYVSAVNVYKHQWQVADAIAQLRAMGLPVVLELIGPSGDGISRLKDTLQRIDPDGAFITYRGAVSYEMLDKYYASADINVFASSCETFGMILTEGMSAGLPIACSDRSAMRDVLGDAGLYFDPENSNDIAQVLQKLIDSPTLRAQLAKAAFDRAKTFSWRKCADETFAYLVKLGSLAGDGKNQETIVHSPVIEIEHFKTN